jgi:hypothetical protein
MEEVKKIFVVRFLWCHSGAMRSIEPGIQGNKVKPAIAALDSGSRAKKRASGMTGTNASRLSSTGIMGPRLRGDDG